LLEEPLHERIERPEADVFTFLDMLIDVVAKRQAATATIKVTKIKAAPVKPQSWVLRYLSLEWRHITEIWAASGCGQCATDMGLNAAKNLGWAENQKR
jgi:hypothetical protein